MYVLSTPIIWVSYFIYQDYIAETFCVNKVNPDCCGKCYVGGVTDDEPKKELPKIHARTAEITSFVMATVQKEVQGDQSRFHFASFQSGQLSNGFDIEIIEPPERSSTTI
jgi:hypothetical protein